MALSRRHDESHSGEITMQTRAGTRIVGQRLIGHVRDVLGVSFKEFIEAQSMFFMATSDDEGRMDCNYRGGMPGFVHGSRDFIFLAIYLTVEIHGQVVIRREFSETFWRLMTPIHRAQYARRDVRRRLFILGGAKSVPSVRLDWRYFRWTNCPDGVWHSF